MGCEFDYDRRAAGPETSLSSYAVRAFQIFRDEPARERSLAVAHTVGRQAARLGMDERGLQSWLQAAYGSVWVRQSNLQPGADLKEVRKELLAGYRRRDKRAREDAATFARDFFQREPALARYAPRRVIDKTGGDARHPEASQHGDEIWLFPKFWRLGPKARDFVFTHEIGHLVLSDAGLSKLVQTAPKFGIDPWEVEQLPFGQGNMDEAFAEAFATAYWSPSELKRRYPAWVGLVKSLS